MLMNINTIPFELIGDDVKFDYNDNSLIYDFKSPKYVKTTRVVVKMNNSNNNDDIDIIESIHIYSPKIVGYPATIQYPVNIPMEVILNDYNTMLENKKEMN